MLTRAAEKMPVGYGRILLIVGDYGQFKLRDNKNYGSHQIALTIKLGRFPTVARHSCIGRKDCVNPKHLFDGSQRDNMTDMFEAGRHISQINKRKKEFSKAIEKLSIEDQKVLYDILQKD